MIPAGGEAIHVEGENWLVALGKILHSIGRMDQINRLACEVLSNGTVIAKDLQGTGRFVVHELSSEAHRHIRRSPVAKSTFGHVDATLEAWLADIDHAASSMFASQAALAAAQMAVPCDSASILQLDHRGLRFVAASGPIATQLVGRFIPADAGAAGFAVQHRQVMVLYEVAEDPRHYQELDKATGYQTRNLCCVPVLSADQVFGVIEVLNFPDGKPFTTQSVNVLKRIAQHLGRRLANSGPIPRMSDPTAPPESLEDPITLDDMAIEPISVEDIALAFPGDDTLDDYPTR
ncbi:MAG: GAF domain-containing protein [Kiritimatiellia bacterium]